MNNDELRDGAKEFDLLRIEAWKTFHSEFNPTASELLAFQLGYDAAESNYFQPSPSIADLNERMLDL